jgi:hypothetical protein
MLNKKKRPKSNIILIIIFTLFTISFFVEVMKLQNKLIGLLFLAPFLIGVIGLILKYQWIRIYSSVLLGIIILGFFAMIIVQSINIGFNFMLVLFILIMNGLLIWLWSVNTFNSYVIDYYKKDKIN